jgi:hypothetical protein
MLAPNAWVSLPDANGPTVLALESGRLGVEARGQVWMRRGSDGVSADRDEARLEVGDGLQLHSDSLTLLHNPDGEPAVALVLTLRSDSCLYRPCPGRSHPTPAHNWKTWRARSPGRMQPVVPPYQMQDRTAGKPPG